ncbi:CHAD domain-containing protein [Novosphingobium malaysiense]|uniref:CHAD domain-containing protein n=1 Tax=Novosphingobium malaysiense TaxID=1348853 RepID=A0A0B1ZJP6_9SPHN|nr:CHAD domain-containing protein [Novosphingobium malaysiense]KHK89537.1 hypothetical protein LK12_20795 [Novosphingobium malaysiense]
MAYKFKASDGSVQRAVRRIAREQIDGALHAIETKDRDTARHEVRKACKKIRALVRLVRPAFSDYSSENAEYRDIARLLAGGRDARVLIDTFDKLTGNVSADGDLADSPAVRKHLEQDLACVEQGASAETHLHEARARLQKARKRIASWQLDEEEWAALGPGLGKVLRRARKARRKTSDDPAPVQFHELRKRIKYHWYHARLFKSVWPEMMKPRAAELSRAADLLGLHHDISVFEERLARLPADSGLAEPAGALLTVAMERRGELESEIAPLVGRLLAQEPGALVDHWRALWCIWRAERAS